MRTALYAYIDLLAVSEVSILEPVSVATQRHPHQPQGSYILDWHSHTFSEVFSGCGYIRVGCFKVIHVCRVRSEGGLLQDAGSASQCQPEGDKEGVL